MGPDARALVRHGHSTCIPVGLGSLQELFPAKGESSPFPLALPGKVSSALPSHVWKRPCVILQWITFPLLFAGLHDSFYILNGFVNKSFSFQMKH